MASRFDPSAFIRAEDEQTLARLASVLAIPASECKPAENCHSWQVPKSTLAAIATIAGVPADTTPWRSDLARFIASDRPAWVPEEHWDELTAEAEKIEAQWGAQAHTAGWTVLDLYGCPDRPLAPRHGQSGLVHAIVTLLTPVRLVSLDVHAAVLQPFRGAAMRYRPSPRSGAVPLWEAYAMHSGP